jgi:hypothetical protein
MYLSRGFFIVGAVVALSSCDVTYGVRRTARLEALPDMACVERAIRETPGVTTVTFEHRGDDSTEATLSGFHATGEFYRYTYQGAKEAPIFGVVQFMPDWRGYVTFENYTVGMNERPPQKIIDATRPLMHQIESALLQKCGAVNLTQVDEVCHGVQCKTHAQ